MNKSSLRLKNEFKKLSTETLYGCTVLLEKEDDLNEWNVLMAGPAGTPYEGGIFKIRIKFPDNYPFKAPDVKFNTTIYHPNIKLDTGEICQDVYVSTWAPTQKTDDILKKIISMLQEPQTSTPLEQEICNEFIKDRALFEKKAKEYTLKYAN